MKPNFRTRVEALTLATFCVALGNSQATTYYWDNNGTTAGFGSASGTWTNPTASLWSTSAAGTATPGASITTTIADTLFFGVTTTGLGAGTINISGTVNASELVFSAGSGAINLTGGTINFAPTFTARNLPGGTAVTGTILVSAPGGATIDSSISGASAMFVKSVAGNPDASVGGPLTLAGANTFSGPTINRSGVLVLGNSLALQNSPLRTNSSASGTATAGLRTTVTSLTFGGLEGGKDLASVFSTVDGGSSAVSVLTLNLGAGRREVYTGGIADGASGMNLDKAGDGNQVLAGVNTYTGTTTAGGGVLLATTPAALPGYNAAGKATVNGGTLGVAIGGGGWTTAQIDTLLSNATKTAGALGIDTSNGDLTQWTAFAVGNLGALGLHKLGGNTLTLNQANTYTGTTTLGGGTLRLQNPGVGLSQALGALALAGDGGTLQSDFNGGSGTLGTSFGALTRATGSSGNIVVNGGTNGVDNYVNLGGPAGFIDKGVFFGGSEFAARAATNGFVRALAYGTDTDAEAVDTITASKHVKLTTSPAARPGDTLLSLNLAGTGVNYTMDSGNLTTPGILKAGGGASTISGGTAVTGGGAELVIRTDTGADQLTISSPVTGAGALTKAGAGTLVLSATANSYTGDTFINGGTLETGRTTTYAGNMTIADGAAFHHTGGAFTINGLITGGGALIKSGAGTLTLAGANSFTGGTTINGGTISIQKISDDAFGTGGGITFNADAEIIYSSAPTQSSFMVFNRAVAINNSAIAKLSYSGNTTITGPVTGTGGIWSSNTNNSQNTLTLLSTANTFTGPVILNGGTNIQPNTVVVNSLADSTSPIRMKSGATGTQVLTFSLGTSATAPLTLNNRPIELGITGSSGGYAISNLNTDPSITLTINTNLTHGIDAATTGTRTLTLGGVNTGNNAFGGVISDGTGGQVIAIAKNGAGTWTLSNSNTYTGLTTVGAGILNLTGSVSSGGVTVNGTGRLNIGNASALGGGTLAFGGTSGPTFDNASGAAMTLATNNVQAWNGDFTFVGTHDLNLGTGAVTMGGNRIVTVSANTLTVGGAIGGAFAINKQGAGTMVLNGANTYTGNSTVSNGRLLINGSTSTVSAFTVNSGSTLGGTGSIGGTVSVESGGTLSPGDSIESLAIGAVSMAAGSTFAYEVKHGEAPGVAADLTAVTGNLTLDLSNLAVLTLTELGAGTWSIGDKLTLISYSGTWNGGLFTTGGGTLADDSTFTFSGMQWEFDYDDTAAGTNFIADLTGPSFVTMTAIPEPTAALLGGLGLLALLRRRRG